MRLWLWYACRAMIINAIVVLLCLGLMMCAEPRLAHAQPIPSLIISGVAHKVMSAGFDTSHVEAMFCVWWHEREKDSIVVLDSAYRLKADSADALDLWYSTPCPRLMATAHWHLLDLGAIAYRSPVDSATLVRYPSPFGVLLVRRRFGDRMPFYLYYDR